MAGLLDYFNRGAGALAGGDVGNYGGLLDEQQRQEVQRAQQMALAAQLLEAGGPSTQRTSLGQALGRGMSAAGQARQGSIDQALQAALLKKQIAAATSKDGRTSFQKDFEYAKSQGFKGTPEDWARVRSAAQSEPAEIQSWNLFKSLPPEEQAKWIDFKRSTQPFQIGEIGGGKVVFNKSTGKYEIATSAAQEAEGAGAIAKGTAEGKITGEQTATAQGDLPRIEDNADQLVKTLDAFEKHPGFKYVFGWDSMAPTIPGSSQAGALAYYDQIKGKNFLEAFNSLKGAGQITEIEGQKATDAIARLDRAQSEEDAKVALADLREVVEASRARARKKAGKSGDDTPKPKRVRVDAQGNVLGN